MGKNPLIKGLRHTPLFYPEENLTLDLMTLVHLKRHLRFNVIKHCTMIGISSYLIKSNQSAVTRS